MATLTVGITHVRDEVETLPSFNSDMSTVGILGYAEDADEDIFPLDKAVLFNSNDTTYLTALGVTGTLADAVAGVSAQLTGGAVAARVMVVRVEEGANAAETLANLIGVEADGTGMWAFLDAPSDLGATPRIIVVPGHTQSYVAKGVLSGSITAPGTGGANGTFALAFTGGTGTGAAGNFTVAGGALTSIAITAPGDYTVKPTFSFAASTGLTGAAATVNDGAVANGIIAGIPTVLERLKAVMIPDGPSTSRAAYLAWLETIQSVRILHPTTQDALVYDAEGDLVTRPMAPRIAGLYVRRDTETDGIPAHSVANQPIYGIAGVSRSVAFNITDPNNEGQDLIAAHGGIVVRGEAGVENSIAAGGFVFWGTDTLSEDPLWMFAHVVRMRDFIELGQVRTLRFFLGRNNISVALVNAVLNTITTQLEPLRSRGYLLDFRVRFEPDKNSASELRLGYIQVAFLAEEAPVLRKITISSRRYAPALTALVDQVATALASGTTGG